jgi:GH43 family beta-xylosidase
MWIKNPQPVFTVTETLFSPGHASFVKSPNEKEEWIVYHTARKKGAGWARDLNIKKFIWDSDGNPVFGFPVAKGVEFPAPAE